MVNGDVGELVIMVNYDVNELVSYVRTIPTHNINILIIILIKHIIYYHRYQ